MDVKKDVSESTCEGENHRPATVPRGRGNNGPVTRHDLLI